MSCAGIISIPLVLACMWAVTVSKQNTQKLHRREIYYGFHRQGTIGLDTLVVHNFCHLFKVKLRQPGKAVSREGHMTYVPQMSATWNSTLLKSCAELHSLYWKH